MWNIITLSIKHGGGGLTVCVKACACMAVTGSGSLVFADDVTVGWKLL